MNVAFEEVAAEVYVLRYPVLDVNVTLIVGDEQALVVDTLSTEAQGRELLTAVRRITTAPLVVVNTHHHYDHCFGNGVLALAGAPIWAHTEAAAALRDFGAALQRQWHDELAPGRPQLAEGVAAVAITVPDRLVQAEATLDVGGRPVVLRHLGRGHTAGDLVVLVPDADTVMTGDLVEEGAPPQFDDAYPLDWPETLAALVPVLSPATRIVPGHGAVVDPAFLRLQHEELTALAWLIRAGHADRAPASAVAAKVAYEPATALVAVTRGYAELDGRTDSAEPDRRS
ncbi:MAG TPA: MBL fold metallo-hydrolase [Micromonosporaceae bacterium]|nr:MBL fold metallo-hydrolase [Micromonosporaceae bacterium]